MIKDKVQKQESGDDSTNLQAQSIVVNQGISYSDAKEIALDVYKANFLQLSQDAAQLASQRAEELTDHFLEKLKASNEAAIESLREPSMQAALYEAQKQYAKTGDKDLEGLLVDILVERASIPERNIRQIVLDEALETAAKLTTEQMDALTLNFLLVQTVRNNLLNLDQFFEYINKEISPFFRRATDESSCYEHLAYTGCITLMETSYMKPIPTLFLARYPALFSKGFDDKTFTRSIGEISDYKSMLMTCFHAVNLHQFRAADLETLKKMCENNNIGDEKWKKMKSLFHSSLMSEEETEVFLIGKIDKLQTMFDMWNKSRLSKFKPTTVGIAIAQANYRRKVDKKLDLGIWVK